MNSFFKALLESKGESTTNNSYLKALLEADENKPEEAGDAEDYSSAKMEDDEPEEEPADDKGEEANKDDAGGNEETEGDDGGENQSEDYTQANSEEDDGGDEGGEESQGEDSGGSSEETTSDSEPSGEGEDNPQEDENFKPEDAKDNQVLFKDFWYFLEQVNRVEKGLKSNVYKDFISSKVFSEVSENITRLKEDMFQYLTEVFINKTYVQNLYQYNSYLEALRLNVQILKKISALNTDN